MLNLAYFCDSRLTKLHIIKKKIQINKKTIQINQKKIDIYQKKFQSNLKISWSKNKNSKKIPHKSLNKIWELFQNHFTTFNFLKVETVSTFNWLKAEAVSTFKHFLDIEIQTILPL